jgi:hypothetical protein
MPINGLLLTAWMFGAERFAGGEVLTGFAASPLVFIQRQIKAIFAQCMSGSTPAGLFIELQMT